MAIKAPNLHANFASASKRDDAQRVGPANYTTTVIRTVKQFESLAEKWTELLAASGESNISLQHAWLQQWLETFPPQGLLTVLVHDELGQLRAVAPLMISRNATGLLCRMLRRLQFIGTCPDVYDCMKVVMHPEADPDAVLRLIADEIFRYRSNWDVIDLRFMESQGQAMALQQRLKPALRKSTLTQPMTIPFIELPEDWSQYSTEVRKKKYHNDLRRIHNHLRKDFPENLPQLKVHSPGPEADKLLEAFLQSHQQYWLSRESRTEYGRHPKLVNFYQAAHREFSKRTADRRPVFEFSTLELGGKPVSYHFDIQNRRGCMGYLSSYEQDVKKYRPGHLHIEAVIERTHLLGGRSFEFGRGDESYKNQWTIQKRNLWSLLGFRTPLSQLAWQIDSQLKMVYRNGKTNHGSADRPA